MNRTKSIQIKAGLLAFVFILNTVIGFACSINIDMGFNSTQHGHKKTEAVVHIHKDGKKHIHYEEKQDHKEPHPDRGEKKGHSQEEKEKGNCCTDQVKKFEDLDKSLPQSLTIIHPGFLIAFFDVYYNADLPPNDIVRNIKQFVRSYHPPIPDIRIAIQSFQI